MKKSPRISKFFFAAFLFLPASAPRAESPTDLAPADVKDLCSYIKDAEAKTDAACASESLAALKAQDASAFAEKLAAARKRKMEVVAAYEFLKMLPSDNGSAPAGKPPATGPDPLSLTPPINDRTFPVWIGAEANDFKAVYGRWLQGQNADLERERHGPSSDEREKQIAAELARNEERISSLEKIKDPARLSCYLGDACGKRAGVSGPSVVGTIGGQVWTAADYARANAQARGENRAPGGKLDRGVPTISAVASQVLDNSPLGPLAGQPTDQGQSPARTAAELALVAAGGLLLFGGLGGKQLEEKFPGIRRNMGIAALVGGSLATGALAWEARLARVAATVLPIAANPTVEEDASETAPVAPKALQPIVERATGVVEAESPTAIPRSVQQAGRVQEYLRQLKNYGEAGRSELENGAIRFYGTLDPPQTPGEMVGRRLVREWNPITGEKRTWFETLDQSGTVRIVRPETGGDKVHFVFDSAGNYVGTR